MPPPAGADTLEARLGAVRDRMARAAARSRRDPAGILLLAVSKVFPAAAIREAYALGLRDFGENYVREFEGKAPEVADLAGGLAQARAALGRGRPRH
jgi:hypothetical protein